jgi:hypothetical protein
VVVVTAAERLRLTAEDPRLAPQRVAERATAALAAALAEFDGDARPFLTYADLSEVAARVVDAVERACESRGVQHALDVLTSQVRDYERHIIEPQTSAAAEDPEIAARLVHHRTYCEGLIVAANAVRRLLATRMPLLDQPAPADTGADTEAATG